MDPSDKSPADLSALLAEEISLVSAGKAELAKAVFDDVLARDSSCAKALCGRGTAYRSVGQIDEAIRGYDAALRIDPKYARAIFNRGQALFQNGSIDDALAEVNKAIDRPRAWIPLPSGAVLLSTQAI